MPPSPAPGSRFLLRVLDSTDGSYVEWAPGRPIERVFVVDLCNRVVAKGVGIFRSSAHVRADVEVAVTELLLDLKREV